MKEEQYKQAWEKFQTKMTELKKHRHEILAKITEKLDQQKMEKLRQKLQNK